MTLFAVFITKDNVAQQLPIAMFKQKDMAERWGNEWYKHSHMVKELEIKQCDVVERTGLVWR